MPGFSKHLKGIDMQGLLFYSTRNQQQPLSGTVLLFSKVEWLKYYQSPKKENKINYKSEDQDAKRKNSGAFQLLVQYSS